MPRHMHMAPKHENTGMEYVVEKIIVLNGVAIAELGGEVYVVPPKTMVTTARGVPHTWVAASPGLDL
jgi:quercetin dioxygenase-like cupin family protein